MLFDSKTYTRACSHRKFATYVKAICRLSIKIVRYVPKNSLAAAFGADGLERCCPIAFGLQRWQF